MQHITRIILLMAAITWAAGASAQKHFASNVAVGGKAGVWLSSVTFSPSVMQNRSMSETFGVTFRYIEEKNFGLVIEANFTKGGWKENFEDTDFKYERQFSYISIPILTHIYFGSHKFKGFFNLGPQLGYNIGENISSNFDYTNWQSIEGFPYENRHLDQLNLEMKSKFDYGLAFGAGMELIAKRKHSIILEGRVYYGLGNIFSSKKADTFSASGNMSVAVTLGYSFRIK